MSEESDSLVVAFATQDGSCIEKAHFGEAGRFEIYRISSASAQRLETVANPHAGEHDQHENDGRGSGRGAGIGRLLGEHGVEVMVSRAFGQNIQRMRQRFVPIRIDVNELTAAVALVQANWDRVRSSWSQGAERKHVVLHGKEPTAT